MRFILDEHLVKLARHLRMIGVDAELVSTDREEGRVLLTCDRALFESFPDGLRHFVVATDPAAQLQEILAAFELETGARALDGFLKRCLECNSPILPVLPGYIRDRVPEHVLAEHQDFFLCTRCERVTWGGGHVERMKTWLLKLVSGSAV